MAEALVKPQDSFSCPVCLDLLKDPVAIPCGHSFCLGCIQDCWDREDDKGVYSCPQCRHTFTPKPALNKNSLIAEMVEKVKVTRLQTAPTADSPAVPPAGSGDVECDVCTGTKHRAVKSCLVCLASYCEAHIQPHYESPAFKKHKLVEAFMNLQEKICSLHDKLLEVFCRTDQQCICLLCLVDEHSGHKTISAAAERSEKQNQLGQSRETCKQQIQQKEKDVQVLIEVMENLRSSAQAAVEDTEKIFTELIQSLERRRSEMKELIRAQEKTELSKTENLLKELEQEIADLRRRDTELEQFSQIEDPIHFLQSFQSLPAVPPATDLSRINTKPQFSIEFMEKLVSQMEQLNGFSKLEITEVSEVYMVHAAEPMTREEFLKCFRELTLNPYSSSGNLQLSSGNKQVDLIPQQNTPYYGSSFTSYTAYTQSFPTYPGNWCQVLCNENLSGRCYWEVEISGNVCIAVSYEGVNWQTHETVSEFGSDDTFWNLECLDSKLCFRDSQGGRDLSVTLCASRIGVYVDHSAGILSFYSVSDTMTLLHRVHTTFAQPLYAGFGMKLTQSSVLICDC